MTETEGSKSQSDRLFAIDPMKVGGSISRIYNLKLDSVILKSDQCYELI